MKRTYSAGFNIPDRAACDERRDREGGCIYCGRDAGTDDQGRAEVVCAECDKSMITKEQLAARLNGREYTKEITKAEEREAKAAGLVVLFGASDDLAELRGAIHDEAYPPGDGRMHMTRGGVALDWDEIDHTDKMQCRRYFATEAKKKRLITAIWDRDDISWQYETDIPHATFDIMEDGETYCRGIVFSLADL